MTFRTRTAHAAAAILIAFSTATGATTVAVPHAVAAPAASKPAGSSTPSPEPDARDGKDVYPPLLTDKQYKIMNIVFGTLAGAVLLVSFVNGLFGLQQGWIQFPDQPR